MAGAIGRPGAARLLVLASASAVACSGGDTAGKGGEAVETDGIPVDLDALDDVSDAGPDLKEASDVESDAPPEPGTFGAPCNGNPDCLSGWCVEGEEGYICTKSCDELCPEGFNCKAVQTSGTDVAFLCLPHLKKLCSPCIEQLHCPGGACLLLDGEGRCGFECVHESDCPEGYTCAADPEGEVEGTFCQPATGSCTCSLAFDGGQRSCSFQNDVGTCFGIETCTPETGWSGCTAQPAAAEACDGVDNDCNGLVDELLGQGEPCENEVEGVGSCPGLRVCGGPLGWLCQGPSPQVEACDFTDNDCDVAVDEDFTVDGKWTLPEHCGLCGNDCAGKFLHGTGKCGGTDDAPICVVDSCDEGFVKLNDFQCTEPPDLSCQPCAGDADCFGGSCVSLDGQVVCVSPCGGDEDCKEGFGCVEGGDGARCLPESGSCTCGPGTAGAKRTCEVASVEGTCFGVETCDPAAGWSGCTAKPPAVEDCNGQDDDCDGFIDEELATGTECEIESPGVGTCHGVTACFGPQGWKCQGQAPAAEGCNFADDDCDGATDEDFKDDAGLYTAFEHCGGCNVNCGLGFPNAKETACNAGGAPLCVVVSCEQGYVKFNDFQCIPNVATLCQPCALDQNCLGDGSKCVSLAEGSFCLQACDPDGACPPGFACEELPGGATQCLPATGSCSCDGKNTDLARACSETFTPEDPSQPAYTCQGIEKCTAGGWGGCTLPAEQCDSLDNDCDGDIDEPFKNGAGQYATVENCGACGISCLGFTAAHASPACSTGGAVPQCSFVCQSPWQDVNGLVDDGCECKPVAGDDFPDVALAPGANPDSNCDGIDGDVALGVFVAKNGSDDQPGTLEEPKLTIDAAVETAIAEGKRDVYVATGVYSENVLLADGIGVYGGYSADFTHRDPIVFETAILGTDPTAERPGAVSAVDLGLDPEVGATVFAGFTVFGPNVAGTLGANSYAIYLRNPGPSLSVLSNRIFGGAAGNGAAGLSGLDGLDGVAGKAGLSAKDVKSFAEGGLRLCDDAVHGSAGGAGGTLVCGQADAKGTTTLSGGKGGDGSCPVWGDEPDTDELGGAGKGFAPGDGGGAGWDGFFDAAFVNREPPLADKPPICNICFSPPGDEPHASMPGENGAPGQSGAAGEGCPDASGLVVDGHWTGAAATPGTNGTHGSGGGGGGSGGGVEVEGTACISGEPLGDCCTVHGTKGCENTDVSECVCASTATCCSGSWSADCVDDVDDLFCGSTCDPPDDFDLQGHDVAGSGGGGGSGGCMGTAGQGGQGGGGSFGLFVAFDAPPAPGSVPDVAGNTIRAGTGGQGGAGGPGGVGGLGGGGAAGGGSGEGDDTMWCATAGGKGGEGGSGGHGGGGGGGCGGSSYGIFVWPEPAPGGGNVSSWSTGNSFLAGGKGGLGGPGGASLGKSGTAGVAGAQANANF